MKKIYLLILLPSLGLSQTESVVNVTAEDLVFSNTVNKIYVSVTAASASNPNSIGMINPSTALIENTFPIGGNPSVLAITPDGNSIYVGFGFLPAIKKFDVQTNTAGSTFTLGSDALTGSFYAEDIEVMPGNNNTIAVARRNHGFAPRHEGVAIFDNGVMRTSTSKSHTGSNQIEFTSDSQLVGFNTETTESRFRKHTLTASGITQTSNSNYYTVPDMIYRQKKFSASGTKAFFSNGKVVDFTALPTISGEFTDANGPSVYDANTNLVCYASTDGTGAIALKFYNPESYALIASFPITVATGNVKNVTLCGNGCYAFNTTDKVVIVNNLLGTPEVEQLGLAALYPNPAKNTITIKCETDIEQLLVYNHLGQLVKKTTNIGGNKTFDVNDLSSGNYIVKVVTTGKSSAYQLIKL